MLILGLDVETICSSPTPDDVIEVGAILWHTQTKREVSSFGTLVVPSGDWKIPPSITELTGITAFDVLEYGMSQQGAWSFISKLANRAEAWCAHNADFERYCIPEGHILHSMACLDTMNDVPYPSSVTSRKLENLGLHHRYPNMNAHRALPDVQAMFNVLSCYEWDKVEAYWHEPTNMFQCLCSFEHKDHAKSLGFHWDASGKRWLKELRQSEHQACLDQIKQDKLPVDIVIVPNQ